MAKEFLRTKKAQAKKPAPSALPARSGAARVKKSKAETPPDALSLLRADHRGLRQLLTELRSAAKPVPRQRLLGRVKQELNAHRRIEEEIFYPAFLAAAQTRKDEDLFHEATAEHGAVTLILQQVVNANDTSEEFPARVKVLQEIIEHHTNEEETDMFPRARQILGASALRMLGGQMARSKRTLRRNPDDSGTLRKMVNFVSSSFSTPKRAA